MTYPQQPQGPYPGGQQGPQGQQAPQGQQIPPAPQGQQTLQGQGPYGQPGQMPPAPGYPAYPNPGDSYGGAPMNQPPSGGTAIAAGVLAVLGAIWAIVAIFINISLVDAASGSSAEWLLWMQIVAMVIEIGTLGAGSVLLFLRKPIGRWLVAAGAAVHILQGIVGVIGVFSMATGSMSTGAAMGGGAFGLFIVMIPAIATLVLALLPFTARWCEWNTKPAVAPAPGYPQQQQW